MARLDGNVLAGRLADLLGWDATATPARCAHCGARELIARSVVYATAMGSVARCASCDGVLATFVEGDGGRIWFAMTGMTAFELPTPGSAPEPGPADVLTTVFDAFNRHDLDAIMAHFADDCVFESPRGPDPWGRRFVGKQEVRRGLAARFEGMPDVQYLDGDHFTSGRRGVSEWTIRGTTVAGERIEVRGCDLWGFDDAGRIVRKDSFWKIREA